MLKIGEIFTPNEFPKWTFVQRNHDARESVERAFASGDILSISGPSKSGKTVLIEKCVGLENIIVVVGSRISSADAIWELALDRLEIPDATTQSESSSTEMKAEIQAKGGASVLGLIKSEVSGKGGLGSGQTEGSSNTKKRGGMDRLIKEISNTDKVLFIDDFHYIDKNIQDAIAKQIKEASRSGVKIVVASVPHRADDVVRSNSELRGRLRNIDLGYWNIDNLIQIARMGFGKANVKVDDNIVMKLAVESSGSPQLMQSVCLELCLINKIHSESTDERILNIVESDLKPIFQSVSTKADFKSLVRDMHQGPRERGTERKEYTLKDNTVGDMYRALLLAIADDPPKLSLTSDEIHDRLRRVCGGQAPQAASIETALRKISEYAAGVESGLPPVEWDRTLEIVDPYFLFYLRWSDALFSLKN